MTDEQRRAADIADKVIARTRYRPGTDNYARVFQAAYVGAIEALTRAETPQSIPSEREEIVASMIGALQEASLALETLARRVFNDNGDHTINTEPLDPDVFSACYYAARSVSAALTKARGEHLTRQALEQGSAE